MPRLHDGEVAVVEGRDFGSTKRFGHSDHARVHSAKRQIGVLLDEARGSHVVVRVERDHLKLAGAQRGEKRRLGMRFATAG